MDVMLKLLQSVSIIIASIVAILGITKWRKEATWKRKFELAEEVLALFYECQEKLYIIRSPAGHSHEGKTRKHGENETPEETQRLDNAYVFIERYENEKDSFVRLWSLKFRFMVVFGKDAGQPFDEMRRILHRIFHAASMLGNLYWKNQGYKDFASEEFERHLKKMEENEEIIWGSLDDTDKVAAHVNDCVVKIENYCASIGKSF